MPEPRSHTVDLPDLIRELTRSGTHRERYSETGTGGTSWIKHHITTVPSLLEQLRAASPASQGSDSGGGGFGSRPAARLEAVDTLMLIDDEAARWVRRLGEDDPGDTVLCVRLVGALYAGLRGDEHADTRRAIEHDVRHWWNQARIVSGWDSAAWRPDNTCPVCEQRRTLRIKLTTQSAMCVECRTVWTPTEIGLLAEHIRAENHDVDEADDHAAPATA